MKRSITAFLVIISLLSALAGSCFEIELNVENDPVEVAENEASSDSADRNHINLDHFQAIVQLAQLIFLQEFNFEIEVPLKKNLSPQSLVESSLSSGKYFRTLFRQIISPNAP